MHIVVHHGHADHVGGVKVLKLMAPGAQYLINEADKELAQKAHNSNARRFMMTLQNQTVFSMREMFSVGNPRQFKIMETPGLWRQIVLREKELLAPFLAIHPFQALLEDRTDLPGGNFEPWRS